MMTAVPTERMESGGSFPQTLVSLLQNASSHSGAEIITLVTPEGGTPCITTGPSPTSHTSTAS